MNPREEIKDIAPALSQWKHNEGYTVPPDYFEKLSDNVLKRKKSVEKQESYFRSLPNEVMNKIEREDKEKGTPKIFYLKFGVAAALVIAAGTILWSNLIEETKAPSYATTEYSEDLDYVVDEIALEDIFDSEFIDDESLIEILANGEELYSSDESVENVLFDLDDELLEEFL